jgi:hypothetical protein
MAFSEKINRPSSLANIDVAAAIHQIVFEYRFGEPLDCVTTVISMIQGDTEIHLCRDRLQVKKIVVFTDKNSRMFAISIFSDPQPNHYNREEAKDGHDTIDTTAAMQSIAEKTAWIKEKLKLSVFVPFADRR